ncbi:MAG: 2-5 ligase family protein [Actinomycetia bacterium]|nr:2-5 ligase family protein [Actinomycetes bacterium]
MRLFIALCPPPDVLDVLDGLARPEAAGVRWTTRDQWHVTLRFLGDVELAEGQVLLQSLAGFPGREVAIGPDTQRLGRAILVAPVTGADDLGAELTPDREFIGHLTLARSRRKHIPDELLGQPVAASWTATSVSLVHSTLAPTGAVYEELGTVPLEGA